VDIITEWSGNRPEEMSQSLEDWWNQTAPGSTHSNVMFDPDGIHDLLPRLKKASPASPGLSAGDFRTDGAIKTLQDLDDSLQSAGSEERSAAPPIRTLSALNRFAIQMRPREPRLRVLLHFKGTLEGAIEAGFEPSSTAGEIAAGSIAASDLDALQRVPNVTFVESSRPLRGELDKSIPEIGADKVWNHSAGNKGANVIVGIIDSGIDYQHPAFRSKNSSRILAIWDQKLVPDASLSESSPAGFDYGVEFDQSQIDAALQSGTEIRHADAADGHGTHVAGIAAGNGQTANVYVGVAPEAGILVVATNLVTNLGDSANTLDAINYLFDKASMLKRPIVVNLSQGDNLGPHDGTSLLEQGIDSLLGKPGRAIVKSAGNNGAEKIHARFTVGAHAVYRLPFDVPKADTTPDSIDIWYSGQAHLQVRLLLPNGTASAKIVPPSSVPVMVTLPNGNGAFIVSSLTNPFNQDHQIYIQLWPNTFPSIQPGQWQIELTELRGFSTDVNAWIEAGSPIPSFSGPDVTREGTITVPGTAQKIITVGAYTTKAPLAVGDMPDFSSWGPCRRGLPRPDLTAPGQQIESAGLTGSGSAYVVQEGTSTAAPHVTGAIALILAEDASLTQTQIKNHLVATARRDTFTGTPPKSGWGAGKLDVDAACRAVRAAKTP
jgi:subtilisin family serine protease